MDAKEFIQALKDGKKLVNRTRNLKADSGFGFVLIIHGSDMYLQFDRMEEEYEFGIKLFNEGIYIGTVETYDWVIA